MGSPGPEGQEIEVSTTVGEIPAGLDGWLVDFIQESARETDLLAENGAQEAAQARTTQLRKLLEAARSHLDAEIDVREAAELAGRSEETIRRAIRDGDLPDLRSNPRGHHRTRRGAVRELENRGRGKGKYDPVADAQDIAKLRRLM